MQRQTVPELITAAEACRKQKKYTEALALLSEAIKLDPQNARAHHDRGRIYKEQGDFPAALADFNMAIKLNPKYATAYNSLGLVYSNQGDSQAAIDNYSKAIELDSDKAIFYYNRASVHYRVGYVAEALVDFNKTIELDPTFASAYNNRAALYCDQGDFPAALSNYNEAIRLDGNSARYYIGRAKTYCAQGNRLPTAFADHIKAIELDPEYTKMAAQLFLRRAVHKEKTALSIHLYLEFIGFCAKHGMKTSEVLDLLEQPLDKKFPQNTASMVSCFEDGKLLATYHALLQQCADNDDNKKRVAAFLEKTIVGFGLLNAGGGTTLTALFKKHGITDSQTPSAPTSSTTVILQSTGGPSLQPVYIPVDELRLIRMREAAASRRMNVTTPSMVAKSSGEVERDKVKARMH